MVFPPFSPLNPPPPRLPFSPSLLPSPSPIFFSSYLLPFLQTHGHNLFGVTPQRRRNNAYPSSPSLRVRHDDYPDEEEAGNSSEAADWDDSSSSQTKKNNKKKSKKKKPRPSFCEQTLERWSVKVSSERSAFPWQEQKQQSGIPVEPFVANSSKSTEVVWDGVRASEKVGVRKSRLDLIFEKLNGSSIHHSLDSCDGSLDSAETCSSYSSVIDEGNAWNSKPLYSPVGTKLVTAPWAHGARRNDRESGAKINKLVENFKFCSEPKALEIGVEDEKLNDSLNQNMVTSDLDEFLGDLSDEETPDFSVDEESQTAETLGGSFRDPEVATQVLQQGQDFNPESGKSRVALIIDRLQDSVDQNYSNLDGGASSHETGDAVRLMGSVALPWERDSGSGDWENVPRKSNTEMAERTIPELELRRLRDAALRMKERMTVGPAGITAALVETIHNKWKVDEIVKLRFEGPLNLNMKRTHEILELKTRGLVIWRSGRSVVLYRGMTYQLPCIQAYSELCNIGPNQNFIPSSNDSSISISGRFIEETCSISRSDVDSSTCRDPAEEFIDSFNIDNLLDQLGPRFNDWSGRDPLPVDADLLPGVIPGYKPPFRLLPYKTRSSLRDREMTSLRRLARTMPPHFALGRSRQHQGLATAMVKLWEKSAIAKIAIKRGVPNTCNERMAEEIKKLTGGVLLSRNKDYIVFYRGNDFMAPSVREVLMEKQKLATIHQDEEEAARSRASTSVVSHAKGAKGPLVAGTLAETIEAKSRWGSPLSYEERERLKRKLAKAKHASLVGYLERKLAYALVKVRKAENALAKVQEFLTPAALPTDLETVTDEEQSLFRNIGLKMKGFLLLGRRGVFDGTIENMHLNWKHRELVKILVKGKSFPQVKHIAISLEAESGGVLISLDKTTKGYAIIVYRGKNYQRPRSLRPKNLLSRRQALARSIELQRREALNHHISSLREKIQIMKSQLDQMENDKKLGKVGLNLKVDDSLLSDDDNIEDEGEEAYLQTYSGSDEDEVDNVVLQHQLE